MNLQRRIVFLTSLLITPFLSNAQAPLKPMADSMAFAKGLQRFSQTTSSIQSEFTQEKKIKLLNDKVVSKGLLYFKKDKLRWEYSEPYSYIITLNGGRVMMKDEGKVTSYDASANKMFLELNDILVTCINGNILDNKKFTFRFLESEKHNVAEMIPVSSSMKSYISKINLYFDKNDFTVARAEMLEPSQNSTVITFRNKKLNDSIADDMFMLK